MKTLQNHLLWTLALAVGTSTIAVMQATAQDRGHDQEPAQNQNRPRYDRSNSPAYQQGMQHGQQDRASNRDRSYRGQYDNDNDRRDYQAGYDQAYGSMPDNRNAQHNRDTNRGGEYGRDAYGSQNGAYSRGGNPAQQVGFQDGVNDGRSDRQSGHSFRATQQQAFKHADHNYSTAYGDRQQYQNMYRQAYQQGYQQGYGSGGSSYRRR